MSDTLCHNCGEPIDAPELEPVEDDEMVWCSWECAFTDEALAGPDLDDLAEGMAAHGVVERLH